MSKGLEALKYFSSEIKCWYPDIVEYKKTIEKELKALEIIKKKEVNVNTLINRIIGAIEPLEFYNEKVSENLKLTQEEFDLLKEVVRNE